MKLSTTPAIFIMPYSQTVLQAGQFDRCRTFMFETVMSVLRKSIWAIKYNSYDMGYVHIRSLNGVYMKQNTKNVFLFEKSVFFFKNDLVGQIIKVRIVWTSHVWRKSESPDFLARPFFAKRHKSGFLGLRILSKLVYHKI